MNTKTLEFRVHSWWHCSTGKGDGPGADLQVIRNAAGLPYIPGKTVKGLLRDAATWLALLESDPEKVRTIESLFGSSIVPVDLTGASRSEQDRVVRLETARLRSRQGSLRVSSAELGAGAEREAWLAWAASSEGREAVPLLFTTLASTRIGLDGTAANRTLREIEVVVPVTLYARVTLPNDDAGALLSDCLPLIRGFGTGRSRGLGRVTVTIQP